MSENPTAKPHKSNTELPNKLRKIKSMLKDYFEPNELKYTALVMMAIATLGLTALPKVTLAEGGESINPRIHDQRFMYHNFGQQLPPLQSGNLRQSDNERHSDVYRTKRKDKMKTEPVGYKEVSGIVTKYSDSLLNKVLKNRFGVKFGKDGEASGGHLDICQLALINDRHLIAPNPIHFPEYGDRFWMIVKELQSSGLSKQEIAQRIRTEYSGELDSLAVKTIIGRSVWVEIGDKKYESMVADLASINHVLQYAGFTSVDGSVPDTFIADVSASFVESLGYHYKGGDLFDKDGNYVRLSMSIYIESE